MAEYINFSTHKQLERKLRLVMQKINEGHRMYDKLTFNRHELQLLTSLIEKAYPDGDWYGDIKHRL